MAVQNSRVNCELFLYLFLLYSYDTLSVPRVDAHLRNLATPTYATQLQRTTLQNGESLTALRLCLYPLRVAGGLPLFT